MQNREMHNDTTVATLAKARAPALSGWKEEDEAEEEAPWRRTRGKGERRAASVVAAGSMATHAGRRFAQRSQ